MSTKSSPDHTFVAAKSGDCRSPCPALNSLANQGYLPRSGRDIGFFQLVGALRQVYNLSTPFAAVLSLGAFLLCGHGFFRLHLDDLAVHNRIEHDASLVHADTPAGCPKAPIEVDPDRLRSLLEYRTDDQGFTIDDFCRARIDIEGKLEKPLSTVQALLARGEVALIFKVMAGQDGRLPTEVAEQWLCEERLPDGWKRPLHTVGLIAARRKGSEVAAKMKCLKGQ